MKRQVIAEDRGTYLIIKLHEEKSYCVSPHLAFNI